MVAVFTTGGVILDSVVTADGLVGSGNLGGNAVYSAAGARLWGTAGCVGLIPRNFPDGALQALRHAGVDTAGLHHAAAEVDGSEWFFYAADGSRVDGLHGPPAAPANRLTVAEAAAWQARLRAAGNPGFGAFRTTHPVEPRHVPPGYWRPGVGVHLAPNRMDAQHRLLQQARQYSAVVSLDPGRQAHSMTAADLAAVLAGCDVFMPSEKELRALLPGEPPARAASLLAQRGCLVVAKLGAAGCVLAERHGLTEIPAYLTNAPDPTGAGDAFCGGFLAGLVRTASPVLAACCGTVSASFAVEGFGPGRLLSASPSEALRRLRMVAAAASVPPAALDALLHQEPA